MTIGDDPEALKAYPFYKPQVGEVPTCPTPLRSLHDLELEGCHAQTQSPLFTTIPAEIRKEIFELSLREYEDLSQPYARDTYFARPGFRGPRRVDVALLRTCRRVWMETKEAPLRLLEQSFFVCRNSRTPPEYRTSREDFSQNLRIRRLTPNQRCAIRKIHVIPQDLTARTFRQLFGNLVYIQPSIIRITIRYTEWKGWETNRVLGYLDHAQMRIAPLPATVLRIVLELETIECKVGEMYRVVVAVLDNPLLYSWRTEKGNVLTVLPKEEAKEWSWVGPTTFGDGKRFGHHAEGDEMRYIVKTLVFGIDSNLDKSSWRL